MGALLALGMNCLIARQMLQSTWIFRSRSPQQWSWHVLEVSSCFQPSAGLHMYDICPRFSLLHSLLFKHFLLCRSVFFSCMYVCAPCTYSVPAEARRKCVGSPGTEVILHTAMSCHVDAGNRAHVLWKSNTCSCSLNHLPNPDCSVSTNLSDLSFIL